jgi:hypothetical protein
VMTFSEILLTAGSGSSSLKVREDDSEMVVVGCGLRRERGYGFLLPFHRDSFFGLYLPNRVTKILSDVWRGFVLQRVLWQHGKQVAFYSSSSSRKIQNFPQKELFHFDDTKHDLSSFLEPLLEGKQNIQSFFPLSLIA